MASTTIKTLDQLRYSIGNARQAGTFTVGDNEEQFAANVADYIDYCEDWGCRVLEAARPDLFTLEGWFADLKLGAYVRRSMRDCLTA